MWLNNTGVSEDRRNAIDVMYRAIRLFEDLGPKMRVHFHLQKMGASETNPGVWGLVIKWPGGTIIREAETVQLGQIYAMLTRDMADYVQIKL